MTNLQHQDDEGCASEQNSTLLPPGQRKRPGQVRIREGMAIGASAALCIAGVAALQARCYSAMWLGGLIWLGAVMAGMVLLGLSAVRLIDPTQKHAWTPGPLIASICAVAALLLAWWCGPFWETLWFRANSTPYSEVIRLVEDDGLRPDEFGYALLPDQTCHLSACGGEVMIDRRDGVVRVIFFVYRDIYDEFAGFVYRSDDADPQPDDFPDRRFPLTSFQRCREIQPQWFYCSNS